MKEEAKKMALEIVKLMEDKMDITTPEVVLLTNIFVLQKLLYYTMDNISEQKAIDMLDRYHTCVDLLIEPLIYRASLSKTERIKVDDL